MKWNYEENKIYGEDENGELVTEVDFSKKNNDIIDIEHVYVSPKHRGKGIAEQTMLVMIDYLRERNLRAIASCSYANAWLTKNEELYADIIWQGIKNQEVACKIDGKH